MKRAVIIVGALLAVSLGAAGAVYGPDQYRIYKAKQAVRQLLRDPESAVFTQVAISTKAVCGMVNSRNGYGAMAGAVPFMAINGQPAELAPIELFHDEDEIERARQHFREMLSFGSEAATRAHDEYRAKLSDQIKFEEWRLRTFSECRDDDRAAPAAKR